MKKVGVAILGMGVVGGGTYKILRDRKQAIAEEYGVDAEVVAMLDKVPERLDAVGADRALLAPSIDAIAANKDVDIVVECMGGLEPAKTFLLKCLKAGKSIVTSNKEMFSKSWTELEAAAAETGAGLYYEATTGGGMPIIRVMTAAMQANKILEIKTIINGTTNYILTKMTEEGASYEEALKDAKRLGYAEADPSADVEGFDAAYKLSILSSLAFHTKVPYAKVCREGIASVDKLDIAYGKEMGYTLKLLAIGKNTERGIEVRVHPTFIKNHHPLASVEGSYNAVYLKGDAMDDIMLYGRGAGALPTASAVVSDVIYAATHSEIKYSTFKNTASADKDIKFVSDFESAYYLRLSAADQAGALAKVAGILAKYGVSIVELIQKRGESECENSIKGAVGKINASGIAKVEAVLHVEA